MAIDAVLLIVPIRHAPLSIRSDVESVRCTRLPTRLSICHPVAPRNVSTCMTPFDPAIHTAAPPSTAAVAANAASATNDCRRRQGTISSVARTSGQSLNAVPIASAHPRMIGRSRRQPATARTAAAVDHASTRLKKSPSTGISEAMPHTAAASPQPQNSEPAMTASATRLSTTMPRPNLLRPPGSRASALKTSSVAIGCST